MKIGVTATRHGLTPIQLQNAEVAFSSHPNETTDVNHGACVGGDEQLTYIAFKMQFYIMAHPPIVTTYLSNPAMDMSNYECEPDDYLIRNRHIVNCSEILLAFPRTGNEELRSGTWATIRYAQKIKKPVVIFWPDGGFEKFDIKNA